MIKIFVSICVAIFVFAVFMLNIWLETHLAMQYLEWFLPMITLPYETVLGAVCFSSLIFTCIKFGLKRDVLEKGEHYQSINAVALSAGWTAALGILWVTGWIMHWFYFT